MNRRIAVMCFVGAYLISARGGLAVERLVPSEYATIQAAIDDCNDGDVIVVAWGTYAADGNHDVDFKGKAVTVRTIDPNDPNMMAVTVICGRGPETQAQVGTGQADVSMFRANAQRTGVYNTRPVRRFGQVKWKFQGDGAPYMDPVVGEGLVYFPVWAYRTRTDCLYAVDAETGEQRWRFQTKTRDSGKGGSTPAIANGSVYFGSCDKYLYALCAQTGLIRWKRKLGQGYSPAVVGETVYFTTAFGCLYALDAANGEVKWRQGSNVRSSPAVARGGVFYSGGDHITHEWFVCKVSAETGEECWTKNIQGGTPCVGNGVVYITWGKRLSALDEATGEIKWRFTSPDKFVNIPYRPSHRGDSSPAVAEGIVCFGCGTSPFYALGINSRAPKWKNKAWVAGSPAVAEGVVYFGGLRGDLLHAVDIESGEVLWQFKAERNIEASPVVSDGVVYFVDNGCNLYAIEGASR